MSAPPFPARPATKAGQAASDERIGGGGGTNNRPRDEERDKKKEKKKHIWRHSSPLPSPFFRLRFLFLFCLCASFPFWVPCIFRHVWGFIFVCHFWHAFCVAFALSSRPSFWFSCSQMWDLKKRKTRRTSACILWPPGSSSYHSHLPTFEVSFDVALF